MTVAVSAVLLCLAAGLAFAMHQSKTKPGSVFEKAWFQGKALRVFPVRSLAYVFLAAVTLFFGMLAVDRAGERYQFLMEDHSALLMQFENTHIGLEYPLVAIRGRHEIGAKQGKRILVLGDSFVWGYKLTNMNQIWWSVMARELERRGYDCEVIAVGHPGAATYDIYQWLAGTSVLEDIRPDLMIIGYVTNDADPAPRLADLGEGSAPKAYDPERSMTVLPEDDNEKDLMRVIFPNISAYMSSMLFTTGLMDQRLRLRLLRDLADQTHANWEEKIVGGENLSDYDAYVLRPMGEFIGRTGIPAFVFPTPNAPNGRNFKLLYRDVLPLFERAGFTVYNPLDEFIERYPRPGRGFNRYFRASPIDPHPGPATCWFLGEYAADVLEREYAYVLGEKRTEKKTYRIEINDWMPYMLAPRAVIESERVSRYVIEYPDQASEPDYQNGVHGNFLSYPLRQKYVKLNFKNPVRLSSVKIEGEELLSARVWTLGINEALGFDDQRPVKWPHGSQRRVTSLLISARTKDGKQAALTVTIEGEADL